MRRCRPKTGAAAKYRKGQRWVRRGFCEPELDWKLFELDEPIPMSLRLLPPYNSSMWDCMRPPAPSAFIEAKVVRRLRLGSDWP